jgi:uncharacterized protein
LGPVGGGERVASIDVLRGFALLGIFVINIWGFGLPDGAESDPTVWGGFTGRNFAAWLVCHLLFEQKMMSIFSMLFGAGLVLMGERSDARGAPLAGVYYRRVLWLLVFGLAHAYLLWDGDILVSYALCGLILYPFRRLRPRTQIALGLCVFLLAVPVNMAAGLAARRAQETALPPLLDFIVQPDSRDPEKVRKDVELHQNGSYLTLLKNRAANNVWEQTVGFVSWAGPRAGGLMLLGMGLMQLGIFSAGRPLRFYLLLAALGYGLGLPVVAWGVYEQLAHQFEPIYQSLAGGHFNYLGSLLVALGHVGVVVAVCKAGRLRWLTARLAAVGRMALSNYLMQTLIATTLFEGWGLGWFGRLDRFQLLGVVLSVWVLQLTVSPLWLRYFRFGPMEWLWRSLTYRRLYPLRVRGASAACRPADAGG